MDIEELYKLFEQFKADQTKETSDLRRDLLYTNGQVAELEMELADSQEEIIRLKRAVARGGPSSNTVARPGMECRCDLFITQLTSLTNIIKEIEAQYQDLYEKWKNLTTLQHILNNRLVMADNRNPTGKTHEHSYTNIAFDFDTDTDTDNGRECSRRPLSVGNQQRNEQTFEMKEGLKTLRFGLRALETVFVESSKEMDKKMSKLADRRGSPELLFSLSKKKVKDRMVELRRYDCAIMAFLEGRAGHRDGPAWKIGKKNLNLFEEQVNAQRAEHDELTPLTAAYMYIMMANRLMETNTYFFYAVGENDDARIVSVGFDRIRCSDLFLDKTIWQFKVDVVREIRRERPDEMILVLNRRRNRSIKSPEAREIQKKIQDVLNARK